MEVKTLVISNEKKKKKLDRLFNDLLSRFSLKGLIFSYKEGQIISEKLNISFPTKNLMSMAASVLETAKGMGAMMNERGVVKIITELEIFSLMIIECDIKTFLVLIIDENSNISPFLSDVKNIIRKLSFLY